MNRLRTGDEVIVISGVSKGVRGQIDSVIYDDDKDVSHVLIKGVNMRWKHSKGNPQKNDPGGRIQQEAPIPVSKVALYNEKKGGADRVRVTKDEDGKRQRVFASDGEKV